MRQGLKQIAMLLALILFSFSLLITSFFRKSIRKARVAKLSFDKDATIFLRCYFLSGMLWSFMSCVKRGKVMMGSLRLWKNFLIKLAIRWGLVILSKYS
jgi:hypothetical protein